MVIQSHPATPSGFPLGKKAVSGSGLEEEAGEWYREESEELK